MIEEFTGTYPAPVQEWEILKVWNRETELGDEKGQDYIHESYIPSDFITAPDSVG